MASQVPNTAYEFGAFRIDSTSRLLSRRGVPVPLSGREFDTLWVFICHPGMPLSVEFLSSAVWRDVNVEDSNLRKQISALRRKLGQQPNGNDYIVTLSNRGYQFSAPVKQIATADSVSVIIEPARSENRQSRVPAVTAISGIVSLALALAALAWYCLPQEVEVVAYRQLTHDSAQKVEGLFTDGKHIFFNEMKRGKLVVASTPLDGGPVTYLPVGSARALAISPQHDRLIVEKEPGWLFQLSLASMKLNGIPGPIGTGVSAAAFDPTGRQLAFSERDRVTIVNLADPAATQHKSIEGMPFITGWDPKGDLLRINTMDASAEVTKWLDLSSNGLQRVPRLSPNLVERHGVWSSDGRFFIFEAGQINQRQIWVRDLWSLRPRSYQLTVDGRLWSSPARVSGTHTVLAIGGQAQGLLTELPPVNSDEASRLLPGVPGYELDYSRDRQWITYTLYPEGSIWRCRTDGSAMRRLTPNGMQAHQPHWSPDGQRVAFIGKEGTDDGGKWRIYLVTHDGGNIQPASPVGDHQGVPTWSADGNSLTFGDFAGVDDPEIHNLDLKTLKVSTIPAPVRMWSPRMSPDGKYLAAISYDSKALYIRNNRLMKWRSCVSMDFIGEPVWQLDSHWVQVVGASVSGERELYRFDPRCGKAMDPLDISSYRLVGAEWYGVNLDDAPLGFLRIPEEIFALEWRFRR